VKTLKHETGIINARVFYQPSFINGYMALIDVLI